MKLTKILKNGCVALSCFLSVNAFATTTTWEWDLSADGWTVTENDGTPQQAYNSIPVDGTNTVNGNTLGLDMSAWADTGANGEELESSDLYFYDNASWGTVNNNEVVTDQPEHSFDNIYESELTCSSGWRLQQDGRCKRKGQNRYQDATETIIQDDYDMALISFDTSVELTDINFGYRQDGDFTLVAYIGAGTPDLNGETWASLAGSSDWLTVGQYNGAGSSNDYYAVNALGVSSTTWLVGAYNSQFGEATDNNIDSGDDAFKIKKLLGQTTTDTVTVPSPATLSLLLASSIFCYVRRRKVGLLS
jgi:hypothetical protein